MYKEHQPASFALDVGFCAQFFGITKITHPGGGKAKNKGAK